IGNAKFCFSFFPSSSWFFLPHKWVVVRLREQSFPSSTIYLFRRICDRHECLSSDENEHFFLTISSFCSNLNLFIHSPDRSLFSTLPSRSGGVFGRNFYFSL